jgi:release factor glutamine methyltransferase
MINLKVQELLFKGYEILKNENIESYMLDSQLLLAKVLNSDRMSIITNRNAEVDENNIVEFLNLVNLRRDKMPLKYITKDTEFMGIQFFVDEGVLIPRADTEVLVEEVLQKVKDKGIRKICDVCSGSGAIGLSIAKLVPEADVYCCDISDKAEEVTQKNIKLLNLEERVRFIKSDLLSFAISEGVSFQAVVSNPPYIQTSIIPTLMEDVKDYEPHLALDGGEDGLDFYRKITEQSLQVLEAGGMLAYEIGYDQGTEVSDLMIKAGYKNVRIVKDLASMDRVVIGEKM